MLHLHHKQAKQTTENDMHALSYYYVIMLVKEEVKIDNKVATKCSRQSSGAYFPI